jgi:hypothetical protein
MGDSYDIVKIAKWDGDIPFDEYGFALSEEWYDKDGNYTEDKEQAVESRELTNPYHILAYGIGNDDYFVVFDFGFLPDNRVALESTVNCESGGWIDRGDYEIVSLEDAVNTAQMLYDHGMDLLMENEIEPSGWGNTGKQFIEDVKRSVKSFDVKVNQDEVLIEDEDNI